jgi:hypothetical protein
MSKILKTIVLLLILAAVVCASGCSHKTSNTNSSIGSAAVTPAETPATAVTPTETSAIEVTPAETNNTANITENSTSPVVNSTQKQNVGQTTENTSAPGTHISTTQRNRQIILSHMNSSIGTNTVSVNGLSSSESPTQFKMIFEYGVEAKNKLDTFSGTFTKDMISCSPITVNLTLTPEELNKIYQKMIETNFFDYPDKFVDYNHYKPVVSTVTPFYSYYFKVEYDGGKIKELSWNDDTESVDENGAKLRELIQLITGVISIKDAYKQLPEPCGGYL